MLNCRYFLFPHLPLELYIALTAAFLLFIALYLTKLANDKFDYALVGMLIGGGLLNILERTANGCVYDYWQFFNLFHFNFPDLVIAVSVLTLGIRLVITNPMPLQTDERS